MMMMKSKKDFPKYRLFCFKIILWRVWHEFLYHFVIDKYQSFFLNTWIYKALLFEYPAEPTAELGTWEIFALSGNGWETNTKSFNNRCWNDCAIKWSYKKHPEFIMYLHENDREWMAMMMSKKGLLNTL